MQPKTVPLVWGVISIGASVWIALAMHNFFGYLVGAVLGMMGWHALKSAVYMTDSEIRELSNSDLTKPPSKETEDKFRNL